MKWPVKLLAKIQYGRDIFNDMNGKPRFAASQGKLNKLNTDQTALENIQNGLKMKPPTHTTDERNAALVLTKADCESLRNDVQDLADADPKNAETIINDSGFKIGIKTIKQKQQDGAKDDKATGDVILLAAGAGGHEWQISQNKRDITTLPSTSGAKTRVHDLPQGSIWFQRNRKILKRGKTGEWSDWKKFVVKGGTPSDESSAPPAPIPPAA